MKPIERVDPDQFYQEMLRSGFVRCPICLAAADENTDWRHFKSEKSWMHDPGIILSWTCPCCGVNCFQGVAPTQDWWEDYLERGSPFSEENVRRRRGVMFERGKTAFDDITAAAWFGTAFRRLLATDPVALNAAEVLAEKLEKIQEKTRSP